MLSDSSSKQTCKNNPPFLFSFLCTRRLQGAAQNQTKPQQSALWQNIGCQRPHSAGLTGSQALPTKGEEECGKSLAHNAGLLERWMGGA
ncbi:uncharacterized [Tachysurus ichikawai]